MTTSQHPGVALPRSAATVGSGYRFTSGVSVVVLSPGMRLTSVVATNSTDGVTHIGFIKTTSAARSADGAYFCITGDAIEAVCVSNSVDTVHTLPNLTNKAWYTLEIVCNEDGSITLTVYTAAGEVHGSAVFLADAPQFGTFEEAGEAHEFCASLENEVFHVGFTQAETVPQSEWVV